MSRAWNLVWMLLICGLGVGASIYMDVLAISHWRIAHGLMALIPLHMAGMYFYLWRLGALDDDMES